MFFKKKSEQVRIANYDGFHTQEKRNCDGVLKTLFFELEREIDLPFIEYLKPFGYPVDIGGGIIEIQRDSSFRIMIPVGRKSLHAEIYPKFKQEELDLLIQQVYRGLHTIVKEEIDKQCEEKALNTKNEKFIIDLKRCNYCLKCAV